MREEGKKKIKTVGRWILLLPLSVIGGFLVFNLGWIIIRFALQISFVDTEQFRGHLYLMSVSNALFGASLVYFASFIAPKYKTRVAIIACILVLIISGAAIFSSLLKPDYWGIPSSIAMGVGAIGVAFYTFKKCW